MKVVVSYYDRELKRNEVITFKRGLDVGVSDRFLTIIYGEDETDYNMRLFNKDLVDTCIVYDAQNLVNSSLFQVKEKPNEV